MADQKTEKATPRRRQKAREQGQIVRTRQERRDISISQVVAAVHRVDRRDTATTRGLRRQAQGRGRRAEQLVGAGGPMRLDAAPQGQAPQVGEGPHPTPTVLPS